MEIDKITAVITCLIIRFLENNDTRNNCRNRRNSCCCNNTNNNENELLTIFRCFY